MAEIRVLAAESTLTRDRRSSRQSLQFWLSVANLAYHKQVEIFWAGEDGDWQVLAAEFRTVCGDGRELWQARISRSNRSGQMLPGNLRFAARLTAGAQQFWDNNGGHDHHLSSHAGTTLFNDCSVQNLGIDQRLDEQQQFAALKVAVASQLQADRVEIHYSSDNWQSRQILRCHGQRASKQATTQIWTARLDVRGRFGVQYAIAVHRGGQMIWDSNAGANYRLQRAPLKVMVLNLHCYQEAQQQHKFRQIAKAIEEQAVDVVCFQEVAEHWNHGHGDWASNSANIINQLLKKPMQLYFDWSHLGFDRYREGVAILSRFPLQHCQSRYVSDSHDCYSIHSRKVVAAQIDIAHFGKINVFSAHLSWWEDGFARQFQRLSDWAGELHHADVAATLLCGDFNIAAGSPGYRLVVEAGQYEDQYLAVHRHGLFEQIFRVNDRHWGEMLADDYRIDYIFLNKNAHIRAIAARVIFTEQDYGTVSDHCGYLMQFAAT